MYPNEDDSLSVVTNIAATNSDAVMEFETNSTGVVDLDKYFLNEIYFFTISIF
jgi:hypothetical protein